MYRQTIPDGGRAKKFYTALSGWKFGLVPEFQYNLLSTANPDGTPGVGGGVGKRVINYSGVKSIDTAIEQVTKPGGKLVSPKMPVPGMGWLASCRSPGKSI